MGAQDAAEYVYLNIGVGDTKDPSAEDYAYLNIGVAVTQVPEGTDYAYLNVIDPPSALYISDGVSWVRLATQTDMQEAVELAEDDSALYAGALLMKYLGAGITSARPSGNVRTGFMFFDTTLGIPVWWDGSGWVDATGTTA